MLSKIIFGFDIDENSLLLETVEKREIGGIILFAKNINDNTQKFLKEIKSCSKNKDIIISVDQEGGPVRRFKDEDIFVMSPRDAVELQNPVQYFTDVEIMAKKLKEYGITLILAPVIDPVSYKNNILYDRSYGNIQNVITYGWEFYRALKKINISHYFGYGAIEGHDPHHVRFEIKEDLDTKPLIAPFYDFIKKGYNDFIMTAHVKYGSELITYSKKWIKEFLKTELNFKGKVITDDLYMKASGDMPIKEKVEKALAAGNDYCIVSGKLKDSLKELIQ